MIEPTAFLGASESTKARNPHLFGRTERAVSEGVDSEAALHEAILKECRERGWIAFHGSMAKATARTLGEPDLHCLLPLGVIIHVECKTKTGKLSSEQEGMKMWMEKLGHTMHIVRSIEDFRTLCVDALKQ